MKKSLLIISCSKSKVKTRGVLPAHERYSKGNAYTSIDKAKKRYFPTGYLDILIISAKYGLLEWDTEIEYYCHKMKKKRAEELRPKVQTDLQSFLEGTNYDKLYICMGEKYRMTLDGFDWRDHFSDKIVAKGDRGKQRNQLIGWLKDLHSQII